MTPSPALPRRIGFHISVGGGLRRVVRRALDRGSNALQVFCGSPVQWALPERAEGEVRAFAAERLEADLHPLVVHGCYLINPCAHDRTVRRRSIRRLADELAMAARMGADLYVLHAGSHKGRPATWGLRRAAQSLVGAWRRAGIPEADSPWLLLENLATPHGPGGDMARLGELARRVSTRLPGAGVGVCIDTAHAFAAGYDLAHPAEADRLAADVEQHIGTERLRLLHVNDSAAPAGRGHDRHADIARGQIGAGGLAAVVNHPALRRLPIVMETPEATVESQSVGTTTA